MRGSSWWRPLGGAAVLQWARATGCAWDSRTCCATAGGGHLEVLQWTRANGCELSTHVCYTTASGGHLEVLQWLRDI